MQRTSTAAETSAGIDLRSQINVPSVPVFDVKEAKEPVKQADGEEGGLAKEPWEADED